MATCRLSCLFFEALCLGEGRGLDGAVWEDGQEAAGGDGEVQEAPDGGGRGHQDQEYPLSGLMITRIANTNQWLALVFVKCL